MTVSSQLGGSHLFTLEELHDDDDDDARMMWSDDDDDDG